MSAPDLVLDLTGIPVMTRSSHEAAECAYRLTKLYPCDPKSRIDDQSDYSRRGSAYHAIKKHYVKLLAKAGTPMDHDLAKEAFQLGMAEVGPLPRVQQDVAEIWRRHSQHFELNLDAYHSTEERIVNLEHDPPYTIESDLNYAHADRNEFETIDDKTFFRTLTEAQVRNLYQARYYTWAQMLQNPGFETYRFTLNFVRLNKFTSVVFKADEFDDLNEEVCANEATRRGIYQRMRVGEEPKAVAGEVCAFCNLACPLLKDKAMGMIRINSPETFSQVAQAKLVQEKQATAMQKALKAYVTVNGPQNVNGEVFQFWEVGSKSYSAPVVIDATRALGAAPDFNVSHSALKKLFKLLPKLEERLTGMVQVAWSSRFKHKSLKSIEAAGGDHDPEGDDD